MVTKIQLSADELKLMQNSQWILTKNGIIEKIMVGFGALSVRMQLELDGGRPLMEEMIGRGIPKITRGEKYQGLPYVMLDYPGIFGKEHMLAIRTFYWWGHFCSITLHSKGRYQSLLFDRISAKLPVFSGRLIYLPASAQEWNHDLHSVHYTLLDSWNEQDLLEHLRSRSFIKLAAKVEFGQWDLMEQRLFDYFVFFRSLIEA